MNWSAQEIGAWLAAIGAAVALLRQGWQAWKKSRKDKEDVKEALDKAPEARQQLALGNVGEAVTHLNSIIQSQNQHIANLEKRLKDSEREVERLDELNDQLDKKLDQTEDEVRRVNLEREDERREADSKIASLQADMEEQKRTFARTLAQARKSGENR